MSSIEKVVEGGYCVGCGACKVASRGAITIQSDSLGRFVPKLDGLSQQLLSEVDPVCPFSDASQDETVLGREIFGGKSLPHDERLGFYQSLYAGRITDSAFIERSSSGGLTTWLAAELLKAGLVDGVIHVGEPEHQSDRLVGYTVSENLQQLQSRTKSRYYTIEFSDVLASIRGNGRRYVFIGVPCFVKAMRLLSASDPVLKDQVLFHFALICGHLKTPAFAELLAWQLGVQPATLSRFDFRVKDPQQGASRYSVAAWADSGTTAKSGPAYKLYGSNWGHAFFQLKACDACDDVMGELGDVTFGDAWLPEYEKDWQGTNIVICRSSQLQDLLKQGVSSGAIQLDLISADQVAKSQDGNYRHRWDGLSLRAADAKRKGTWFPHKRIAPGSRHVDFFRKRVVRLRARIAEKSHTEFLAAKSKNDLSLFLAAMEPLTQQMRNIYDWSYRLNPDRLKKLLSPAFVMRKILSRLGM
ncbi:Coenzyme F420 hydrogenase/dehydrogenase, beta subunit C-terminal domain [Undibacterium terreum]|uniref:Coenzyme F420 hydrogenase n=1 Tax=Undibacterium terreum TaxID=1224302 RepID=A0A916XS86_9BURK|nr:Coenzyme F420 hydrogenase/dehydrogenase, beta subunit C-terminal domain [Undibacterium terreum]GGC97020.1 coenzyme F420 hydrogenase [Undibacterium terreum]